MKTLILLVGTPLLATVFCGALLFGAAKKLSKKDEEIIFHETGFEE